MTFALSALLGLLPLYTLTPLALPHGASVELGRTAQPLAAANAPPAAIAMSQRGSVAIIAAQASPRDGDAHIVVFRADGTRVLLDKPPHWVLQQDFMYASLDARGRPSFGDVRFANVCLAADGTPFATLELPFSGAYSGTESTVYAWNGERWSRPIPSVPLPTSARAFTIEAAQSTDRFVIEGTYSDAPANLDEAERDPDYEKDVALMVQRGTVRAFAFAEVTALRGEYAVGYDGGFGKVTISSAMPKPIVALRWRNGVRETLGPGFAYAVDAQGDVVGEDGTARTPSDVPVLWQRGRRIALARKAGAAYAIADDGTIVGKAGDDGIISRLVSGRRRTERLDALVANRHGWHVTAAYAIAAGGRILAVGTRAGAESHVLVLDPIR